MIDLTEAPNFQSNDWKYVLRKIEKALENSRSALEKLETGTEDTLVHRGRIAALREIQNTPKIYEEQLKRAK